MGTQAFDRTVKAARKSHVCTWCGEQISAGGTYHRYRWFYDDGARTCRMHPECYAAMNGALVDGELEFSPGENDRPA